MIQNNESTIRHLAQGAILKCIANGQFSPTLPTTYLATLIVDLMADSTRQQTITTLQELITLSEKLEAPHDTH